MQLLWHTWDGKSWSDLLNMDLSLPHFNTMEGVYVIWSGSSTVRVGQGIIRDRLGKHRNDRAITAYPSLLVTWAPVEKNYRDGVERYLANTLKPKVGDAFPDTIPIAVNLPW